MESDSSFQSIGPPLSLVDTTTTTTTVTPVASSNPSDNKRKRPRVVSTSCGSTEVKRHIFIRRDDISDKILMDISHKASYKYLEVGIQLGLTYSTIQNTVGGSREHLKTFHVLQEWKARAANEFTFSKLAHALEQVGLISLAQEFCYIC